MASHHSYISFIFSLVLMQVLIIAAAGNDGNSDFSYPASYESVMSIAAVRSNKNKASFSQFNDQVELSGPGVLIKSTLPNNQYGYLSGTSMVSSSVLQATITFALDYSKEFLITFVVSDRLHLMWQEWQLSFGITSLTVPTTKLGM